VRVGIIGTGLIGASIGAACRNRGDAVLGFDRSSDHWQLAIANGNIDAFAAPDEIYASCQVVVIALPVDATIEAVHGLRARTFAAEQLVIDVASVKGPIEEAGRDVAAFVPTHPMAGGEGGGPGMARADLFAGRWWARIPTRDLRRTEAARAFIGDLGAHPFTVAADVHDRVVALTSHLPQLMAYGFSRCVRELSTSEDAGMVNALCGPVARELLRISRSSREMWDPIFAANAAAIEDALTMLKRELE